MSFPFKLYQKLAKLDFVDGVGVVDGKLVVYVSRPLNDTEAKKAEMLSTRKMKFVVAEPIKK